MTEKEKMLAGKSYFSGGEELTEERQRAKRLTYRFNNLHPDALKEKEAILRELFGTVGENLWLEEPLHCDYGYNVHVGNNFYGNYNLVILDCAEVNIGNNVFIAPNVSIFAAGHPLHHEARDAMQEYAAPVTIGNSVWIGGGVIINPGVTIGSRVVIGSGSVVTKDIPDNCIAAGNPCRVIREITEEDSLYYFKKKTYDKE